MAESYLANKAASKAASDPRVQEAAMGAAAGAAEKAGVDKNAINLAMAAQKGDLDVDAASALAAQKLQEQGFDVMGEDGKIDPAKMEEAAKQKAAQALAEKIKEAGGEEFLDQDGNLSKEAAERQAKKLAEEKAKQAITEKFGEGAAAEFTGIMGEDGVPDKEKMKAKAQGFLSEGLSKFGAFLATGGKGTRFEELGDELLADAELDGLEMGLEEVQLEPEFTDPWLLMDEEMDLKGYMDEDLTFHNQNKAEKHLHEVQFKQVMYDLSYHYYAKKNDQLFITPSIVITSLSSLLSFIGASLPEYGQKISLLVGFLGTVATVITSLRSQYKFDSRAEMFRSAAADYSLISLKLKSKLIKEQVSVEAWENMWKEIEAREQDIQKRLTVFPPDKLVKRWRIQGRFTPQGDSKYGGTMPPWTRPFKQQLKEDGVQSAEDMEFVEDEKFTAWSKEGRYPSVVVKKIHAMREHLKECRVSPAVTFGIPPPPGVQLHGKLLNHATLEEFRKKGVDETRKLRMCTQKMLDSVVDTLVENGQAPYPDDWHELEVTARLYRKYGDTVYPIARKLHKGGCIPLTLDPRALERIEKVRRADEIVQSDGTVKSKSQLAKGGGGGTRGASRARSTTLESLPAAEPAPKGGGGGGGGGLGAGVGSLASRALKSQQAMFDSAKASVASKRPGRGSSSSSSSSGGAAEEGADEETERLLQPPGGSGTTRSKTPVARAVPGAKASADPGSSQRAKGSIFSMRSAKNN